MTRQDEELLAEWLLCWEEAREQGRTLPAAELAGSRCDLAAELGRRIRILEETAWLDDPLDDGDLAGPIGDAGWLGRGTWPRPSPPFANDQAPAAPLASGRRVTGATMAVAITTAVLASIALALFAIRAVEPSRERAAESEILAIARSDFFHARYPEAEAGFTMVLALAPHDHEARVSRGISRLKLGRLEAAVADFTAALERLPADREALRQRAQAFVYLKRYGDAISDLERLLATDGDAAAIRQQIEALRAGVRAPANADQSRLP